MSQPEPTAATGVELIRRERRRQRSRSREGEAYSLAHDDAHDGGELARAAACYAMPQAWRTRHGEAIGAMWPQFWRFKRTDRVRELVIAGALIAAEIDRLQRRGDAVS